MDDRTIDAFDLLGRVLMAAAIAVLVLGVLGAILRLLVAERSERLPVEPNEPERRPRA